MDVASLSRAITVRHKEPGHLRLELPLRLFDAAARAHLDTGLRERLGVYRVHFEPKDRRLSIRYEPQQCTQQEVARQLRSLLDTLPPESPASPASDLPAEALAPQPGSNLLGNAGKWADRFLGGSIKSHLAPVMNGALTEKASINFLNDVLMFYLVKVHWDLISKRWMKDPIKHADAWLTTFYLIFLLIRYRKSAK
jgi:hypothetical protein